MKVDKVKGAKWLLGQDSNLRFPGYEPGEDGLSSTQP